MKKEFVNALEKLKHYCNKTLQLTGERNTFTVTKLTGKELDDVRTYTRGQLPEAYFYFLGEIGFGKLFYNEHYGGGIEILGPQQLLNCNKSVEDEILAEDEPTNESFIMIGIHQSMGDWIGFNISKVGLNNFDVYSHEYPIFEYASVSDELNSWRSFEDWIITIVSSNGEDTL